MGVTKRILCLANSRKFVGRCVAGKDVSAPSHPWIRPVSSRHGQEVSRDERAYDDGQEPRLLDVVDVPLIEPKPAGFQSENWIVDPLQSWTLCERLSVGVLEGWVDAPPTLWLNSHKTYHGSNDQVPESLAGSLTTSLYLIAVTSVDLHVFAPGAAFGDHRRRVQARFIYGGVLYGLRVTDPVIEDEFLAKPDGAYPIGAAFLTISLSAESYKGSHYKLVAAIIRQS